MTVNAGVIYEVNASATASNVNGGGFNPNNVNMLTDGAATVATGNSPVFTSASYNFVAGDVGHWVFIKSGTNWTVGWYKIASVAANAATLTATVGTAEQYITAQRIGANTVAGCATTASPTGATWTIDYSRSTASPFAVTDLASTNGTTNPATVTSAAAPFGKNHVGNVIHVTAGTNWTAAWYEIVSISGTTATLDAACGSSATLSSGTAKTGGALCMGALDDAAMENAVSSTTTASIFYFKGPGTHTLGAGVSIAAVGNNPAPCRIEGYTSIRGDRPTIASGNQPTIAMGANTFTITGNYWAVHNITATCTVNVGFNMSSTTRSLMVNCKVSNTSNVASRNAIGNAAGTIVLCEAMSYLGTGIASNGIIKIFGCSVHDSNKGIVSNGSTIVGNLLWNHFTSAIETDSSNAASMITNNTLYGAENKLGIGINILATVPCSMVIMNNIIYGFVSGMASGTVSIGGYSDYNDFYNNTNDIADVTKCQKGPSELAVDPVFTSVTQRSNTTATTTAGQHLVQTGATFVTWGITTANFVVIKSGTGKTVGTYGIASVDSETQITLDNNPGTNATADGVWQITQGLNFAIGTNLKAAGSPGAYPTSSTTSYLDIGAIQRQEAGGGGSTAANPLGGFVG